MSNDPEHAKRKDAAPGSEAAAPEMPLPEIVRRMFDLEAEVAKLKDRIQQLEGGARKPTAAMEHAAPHEHAKPAAVKVATVATDDHTRAPTTKDMEGEKMLGAVTVGKKALENLTSGSYGSFAKSGLKQESVKGIASVLQTIATMCGGNMEGTQARIGLTNMAKELGVKIDELTK